LYANDLEAAQGQVWSRKLFKTCHSSCCTSLCPLCSLSPRKLKRTKVLWFFFISSAAPHYIRLSMLLCRQLARLVFKSWNKNESHQGYQQYPTPTDSGSYLSSGPEPLRTASKTLLFRTLLRPLEQTIDALLSIY